MIRLLLIQNLFVFLCFADFIVFFSVPTSLGKDNTQCTCDHCEAIYAQSAERLSRHKLNA